MLIRRDLLGSAGPGNSSTVRPSSARTASWTAPVHPHQVGAVGVRRQLRDIVVIDERKPPEPALPQREPRRTTVRSKTNVVRLWDPRQWDRDGAQLKGHTDNVRALALSTSGKLLLSGSSDNTIRLWDLGQQPAWMRVFLLQVYSCSKPRV